MKRFVKTVSEAASNPCVLYCKSMILYKIIANFIVPFVLRFSGRAAGRLDKPPLPTLFFNGRFEPHETLTYDLPHYFTAFLFFRYGERRLQRSLYSENTRLIRSISKNSTDVSDKT